MVTAENASEVLGTNLQPYSIFTVPMLIQLRTMYAVDQV